MSSLTPSSSPKTTSINLSQSLPSTKSPSFDPKSPKASMELVDVKTSNTATEILVEDSPKNEKINQQSEIERLKQEAIELKKQLNLVKTKITGYVDLTSGTLSIDSITLRNAILKKVQNVYDSINVEQIDYLFGGEVNKLPTRKITLERTWNILDVTAFSLPVFSILFNPHSIYIRTIDKNSLAEYILDADVPYKESTLQDIFQAAKNEFEISKKIHSMDPSKIDAFKKAAEDKFCKKIDPLPQINADLKTFLNMYKKHFELHYPDPHKYLEAAYWQSKSIVIYVPNACNRNAEIELIDKGVVTHVTIKIGKFLKSLGL